ncbi:hypothetical protein N7453_001128 [Penicillium expansum]|nr:hypothetical protein N7453_001128 [Penicillium expansum]
MSASYADHEIINLYIQKVKRGCKEDKVDHMWTQILRFYFPLQQGYGLEREPYTSETTQARANIVVTNVRENSINKVLFVECKALKYKNATPTKWGQTKVQLENNMRSWSGRQPNSPLYAITVIGRQARFFTMAAGSTNLVDFGAEDEILSVKDDAVRVQQLLLRMEALVSQNM